MLHYIQNVLISCLLLMVVGQQVAAQNADDAVSEQEVTAEQTSGASEDAADADAQAAAAAASGAAH